MFGGVTEREAEDDLESAFAFLLGVRGPGGSAEVLRFVADVEDSTVEAMVSPW